MATDKQKEAARRNIGKARQAQSARARGEEMHLTSPWAQLKRNVKMALKHRLGRDKTGIQLGSFYDYDVAVESGMATNA